MSTRTCYAAFTAPTGGYPPYISINDSLVQADAIEITVREAPHEEVTQAPSAVLVCGKAACIEMSRADFRKLLTEALAALDSQDKGEPT